MLANHSLSTGSQHSLKKKKTINIKIHRAVSESKAKSDLAPAFDTSKFERRSLQVNDMKRAMINKIRCS